MFLYQEERVKFVSYKMNVCWSNLRKIFAVASFLQGNNHFPSASAKKKFVIIMLKMSPHFFSLVHSNIPVPIFPFPVMMQCSLVFLDLHCSRSTMEADAFLMIQRRVPRLLSNWVVNKPFSVFFCVFYDVNFWFC